MTSLSEFEKVCEIIPIKNNNGKAIEFFPAKKYQNVKNLPLNKYGNGPFCKFEIGNKFKKHAGVYIILLDGKPVYVGECDNLASRYNTGYGNISPRNCFQGGQNTNCRINSKILTLYNDGHSFELRFLKTQNRFEIEYKLIKQLHPEWNKTSGKPKKIRKSEKKYQTNLQ